ncbi:Protein MMF1 [Lachnellula suecica]|uniref:Protein MMF1 n=1 Tax=Lachnellula suecica TaxID=602035 RepID=A0A8T9C1X2_9HELO|nr:Protein MMF1 [Lachnellula suecica]
MGFKLTLMLTALPLKSFDSIITISAMSVLSRTALKVPKALSRAPLFKIRSSPQSLGASSVSLPLRRMAGLSTWEKILTKNAMAPACVRTHTPQSQAIKTPYAIYVSGQLPADAQGNMVQGSMTEKTSACMKAIEEILAEAGSGLEHIVKVTIFLTDMKDFEEVNKAYESWMITEPARSCVAVKQLPKDADIEIECIALPWDHGCS